MKTTLRIVSIDAPTPRGWRYLHLASMSGESEISFAGIVPGAEVEGLKAGDLVFLTLRKVIECDPAAAVENDTMADVTA